MSYPPYTTSEIRFITIVQGEERISNPTCVIGFQDKNISIKLTEFVKLLRVLKDNPGPRAQYNYYHLSEFLDKNT